MRFYGFEYADGIHTTTGQPNNGFERFNGRMSIAGGAVLFASKKERQSWIDDGCDSYGGRIAVNRAELRRLCAGMENEVFAEYLKELEYELELVNSL